MTTKRKRHGKDRALAIAVQMIVAIALGSACANVTAEDARSDPRRDERGTPLKEAYAAYFPIGAAVAAGEYGFDSFVAYPESLLSEFNSLVAENCMKPIIIHPAETSFNWAPADKLVAFARAHAMKVRGHTLVWHNQIAPWMFKTAGSVEERREYGKKRMRAHIAAVVGRYANDVYCWDVVNEAVKDNWDPPSWATYRESSPWFKAYGDASYIRDAFDFARAADPDAKLFYNDYNLCDPAKRSRALKMIRDLDLKAHGLDGVGLQGHWTLSWPSVAAIQETVDEFASLGLEVQITELDIDCYDGSATAANIPYASVKDALTERYRAIFECFRKNKGKITGVTLWGVADDHTWLDYFFAGATHAAPRKNYPLLFAENLEEKDAYFAVRDFR